MYGLLNFTLLLEIGQRSFNWNMVISLSPMQYANELSVGQILVAGVYK